jgi:hypothetical protein
MSVVDSGSVDEARRRGSREVASRNQRDRSQEIRSAGLSESTPRKVKGMPSLLRALLAGVVVLALILGVAAAYYAISGFFNADGPWYGTMNIHTQGRTVAIETYMNISTSLIGSISGEGTFCVPLPFSKTATVTLSLTGDRVFSLPTTSQHDQEWPISLTVQYRLPLLLGFALPLGPSLQLKGAATVSSFHLLGGNSTASASLEMKHGSQAAFLAACRALAPLG